MSVQRDQMPAEILIDAKKITTKKAAKMRCIGKRTMTAMQDQRCRCLMPLAGTCSETMCGGVHVQRQCNKRTRRYGSDLASRSYLDAGCRRNGRGYAKSWSPMFNDMQDALIPLSRRHVGICGWQAHMMHGSVLIWRKRTVYTTEPCTISSLSILGTPARADHIAKLAIFKVTCHAWAV